jgi:hypothetical protein
MFSRDLLLVLATIGALLPGCGSGSSGGGGCPATQPLACYGPSGDFGVCCSSASVCSADGMSCQVPATGGSAGIAGSAGEVGGAGDAGEGGHAGSSGSAGAWASGGAAGSSGGAAGSSAGGAAGGLAGSGGVAGASGSGGSGNGGISGSSGGAAGAPGGAGGTTGGSCAIQSNACALCTYNSCSSAGFSCSLSTACQNELLAAQSCVCTAQKANDDAAKWACVNQVSNAAAKTAISCTLNNCFSECD